MRRRSKLAGDTKGAGGFMEAILAITVISVAFALVAVTVPGLGSSGMLDDGLLEEAGRLRDRIFATASVDGLVIEARLLHELEGEVLGLDGGQGMRVELELLGGGEELLLIASSGPLQGNTEERYVLREPACYSSGEGVVRAAILVVTVW